MTDFEKRIYNEYLITSRSIQNKPFKVRQDFTGFEEKETYLAVMKLARFFEKFPHLDIKTFFEAPYFVTEFHGEQYFPIEFYCTQKAIATYTKYHDTFLIDNPDASTSLEFIKNSIVFIYNYCKSQGISLKEYLTYSEGVLPAFLVHLKNRKISLYSLFAFRNLDTIIKNIKPMQVESLCFPLTRIDYVRTKLYTSVKAKKNIGLFRKLIEK